MGSLQLTPGSGNRRWVMRRALLIFLPPALMLMGLLSYLYVNERDADRYALALSEQRNVELSNAIITSELNKVAEDVRMVRRLAERMLPHVEGSASALQTHDLTTLSRHFKDLSNITQKYDQIRLLGIDGQETIRINLVDGQAVVVPDDELQNKQSRYYFKAIMALKGPGVYVSPLDLNVEHGAIEIPLKPMLRLGAKVADAQEEVMAAVILNLLGETLFSSVHVYNTQNFGNITVVNADGFWLHNHDPAQREWGFMLGHGDDRFQADHPDAWSTIINNDAGQFMAPTGLISFSTIYPTQIMNATISGSRMPQGIEDAPHDTYWKIISVVPHGALNANDRALMQRLALMGVTALVLMGTVAFFIAQTQSMREEVAQRIERLENQESLGLLANSVAHEFNNLLVPIRALSEMVMNDLPEDSRERRRIEKVFEASLRAKKLVEGILVFGKEYQGEDATCNIVDVVSADMALIKNTMPATVKLVQRFADNVPHAHCSERQSRNILINMVSNARDALQGHVGTITVSLDVQIPSASLTNTTKLVSGKEYICLTVQDDGCGMDDKTLHQALDPFFTTKTVGEGHGLGLYQVNMLATASGGALTIDSAPNVGTTATVWMPTNT